MNKPKTTATVALTTIVVIAFTALVAFLSYRIGHSNGVTETYAGFGAKLSPTCFNELRTQ